jgi:predicted phosphodiesterase
MEVFDKEIFDKIVKMDEMGASPTTLEIQNMFGMSNRRANTYRQIASHKDDLLKVLAPERVDVDIVSESVKLAKQKQRYQDSNRIERKAFREHARVENAITSLNEAVLKQFAEVDFNVQPQTSQPITKEGTKAIIQFTDAHFNELIDLDGNRYDFKIASQRMREFAKEAKRYCKANGVDEVLLALTGDMINSDRRLDEKLNMSTNRTNACLLATKLIQLFIQDLLTDIEHIDVTYVTGNESRVMEFGFSDIVITDNYDTNIFNMLTLVFEGVKRVKFLRGNPVENVVTVNGKNVLLLHGTTLGQAPQANLQKLFGKYALNGIKLDYAIFGHIHFANITDLYARSASLSGGNSYSDYGLGLASKASQNIHFIKKDGTINNVRVELQQADNEGYDIEYYLDAYDVKPANNSYKGIRQISVD